ncbi:hypothetical protein [Clostridium tarantellae]|uniref:Uncharacterized protein n=1 Tax=Clostridium tarantellae TaxID=39493 RepID=A0A6I1MTD8_9CLOT|nr:hypothetical protein [Clostridium tarantellae]MPQ44141.1 hypothetical protein [Clostridium tarantellae]
MNKNNKLNKNKDFIKFIKKQPIKIIIHLLTIIVWAFFLKDFFVYKSTNSFYSVGISLAALLTFFLELKIMKK